MLQGKVLGVVGTGSIGAEMARLGRAIGMEVIAWTFHPSPERAAEYGVRFVELDELLQTADVDAKNKYGLTPLHYAALLSASATAEVLRRYGARK